jgi:hypothetical protein
MRVTEAAGYRDIRFLTRSNGARQFESHSVGAHELAHGGVFEPPPAMTDGPDKPENDDLSIV